MNLFQALTLPPLALLLLIEIVNVWRLPSGRLFRLVRCLIWSAALTAIAEPGWTSRAASIVGIDRGADLVNYLSSLALMSVSFYFYARNVRLQRQITEIVRYLAIMEARSEPRP